MPFVKRHTLDAQQINAMTTAPLNSFKVMIEFHDLLSVIDGAGSRSRTGTHKAADFKSAVSTYSTIPAIELFFCFQDFCKFLYCGPQSSNFQLQQFDVERLSFCHTSTPWSTRILTLVLLLTLILRSGADFTPTEV